MSKYKTCKACGNLTWKDKHECNKYEVVNNDNYDWESPHVVYASDPEEAAEKTCRDLDYDNEPQQDEVRAIEVKSETGEITKFKVTTCIEVNYRVRELEE